MVFDFLRQHIEQSDVSLVRRNEGLANGAGPLIVAMSSDEMRCGGGYESPSLR